MIKDAFVKSLQDEARTPRYMAGDGADWCEVNANLLTQAADTIEAQARRIEALEELCDAACSNAETALRFLAEAGRPGLAEIQSSYITNIRAALAPTP